MNPFEIQIWLRLFGMAVVVDGKIGRVSRAAAEAVLKSYGITPGQIRGDIMLAFEQLVMKEAGQLRVGPIDGLDGPVTRAARDKWLKGIWRNPLMETLETDPQDFAHKSMVWPKQSEMDAFFGKPGTNMTTIHFPFPMVLSWQPHTEVYRTSCNTKVKDSLVRVLQAVKEAYTWEEIQRLRLNSFGGCYNLRRMRGGTRWSTHAYGAALDFDTLNNALRMNSKQAAFAKPAYNKWWKCWEDEGWVSLGRARDFDWMHVQAARLG